jgi:leucyl aminopeptidase (aminopeptidase T)
MNGRAIIDSYFWPPKEIGPLEKPIHLDIERGKVSNISSDTKESCILEKWLKGRDQNIAHLSIGTHPKATLNKSLLEAERHFGSLVIGIGQYPFHADGIIKKPKIDIDEAPFLEAGRFLHKDLQVNLGYFDIER